MAKLVENLGSLFGKKVSPDELVREWRQKLRAEQRSLDRNIRSIELQEEKVKKTLKQAAKRGDQVTCKNLAKELVNSRRSKDKMHTSKAQMNSVIMHLQQQLAMVKVAGSLQKSGEVMKLVNSLIKLPEVSATMQTMAMEMTKAGIIDEMIQDTLEAGEDDDIEIEADEEVNKVLFEVTEGLLGQAGAVGKEIKTKQKQPVEEMDDEDLHARTAALRG